ncbi:aminoglycoside phosphotransferase family protein [Paenibacillus sp. CF384]|uniref:aminoglycoside phosphotransferase family protein n=1 Tax=Paenibacillus sp. CF384 TaxID=1884382 RepID=UPI00089814E3|nr:aminoglycoside phosphotransferase family protein [Paenibacillus sp. CF384]SDW98416.1 Phosphotransferase enzyme family protein [Paenibacillus sp. CF384]
MDNVNVIYGVLPHPTLAGRVFVQKENDEWCLPYLRVEEQISSISATREMSRLFGQTVVAYRYVSISEDLQTGRREGIFLLDNLGSDKITQEGKWVSRDDLANLQFKRSDHLEVLYNYYSEPETVDQPKFRRPWENSGWFTAVTNWIQEVVGSLGGEVIAQPELMKWWSLSCVLRVPTTQGNVYFKVNAEQPLFVDEARFLELIGNFYPGRVPVVLGTEPRYGWMLASDSGKSIRNSVTLEQKMELLRVFAGIQLDSINHIDELLEVGCADRRPQLYVPFIAPLLDDELMTERLTPEEISELRKHLPTITEMCLKLSEYKVPSTLLHGDLNLGNVTSANDRLSLIDWTDASVGHPFMDMFLIFDESDVTLRTQLRDVYLAMWSDFEPEHRLLELWSLCEVIHAIHHAISYQSILHHTEERARPELDDGPPFYLRKALRFLHEQGEQ